ncbi:MAG TPA: hypothetical protein PKE54_19230 [Candidatus Obscuribacter sp.]|nr:hypothetical protein [Candidatus Obscuribacter sp.]HMW92168.1 hypothetical protein [Candidatus Obscuribacter sp.]
MRANFPACVITFLLAISGNLPALADGLVNMGHISGPHTRLLLTSSQKLSLDKGARSIDLTGAQKKALGHIASAKNVGRLSVLPKTIQTCTCELSNVSIRLDRDSIEVADNLLGRTFASPLEVRFRSRQRSWQLAQKDAPLSQPPKAEELLNARGNEAGSSIERSISFYKQALAVNPNYVLARRNLANCYSQQAWHSLMEKRDSKMACRLFELALANAEPSDEVFRARTESDLSFARSLGDR